MSDAKYFYLAQADNCLKEAAATPLAQVREHSLRSAAAWQSMADKIARAENLRLASRRDTPH